MRDAECWRKTRRYCPCPVARKDGVVAAMSSLRIDAAAKIADFHTPVTALRACSNPKTVSQPTDERGAPARSLAHILITTTEVRYHHFGPSGADRLRVGLRSNWLGKARARHGSVRTLVGSCGRAIPFSSTSGTAVVVGLERLPGDLDSVIIRIQHRDPRSVHASVHSGRNSE